MEFVLAPSFFHPSQSPRPSNDNFDKVEAPKGFEPPARVELGGGFSMSWERYMSE